MSKKFIALLTALLMISGVASRGTFLYADGYCPAGDCNVNVCPCPQDPVTPNCPPPCCPVACPPPCDPCDPCAPICGTQCGICCCAIGVGIIAIAAAAAIIATAGNDPNGAHTH